MKKFAILIKKRVYYETFFEIQFRKTLICKNNFKYSILAPQACLSSGVKLVPD